MAERSSNTEYAVELLKCGNFCLYYKRIRRTFAKQEDAEWMAKYYWCVKGRFARVVSITEVVK